MSYRLDLHGRVQGVGCRYYCSQVARRLGISGSASNLPDGSVMVLINSNSYDVAKQYADTLVNNTLNLNFYGRINKVSLSTYNGRLSGDYTF
jgi:acylphosphatase